MWKLVRIFEKSKNNQEPNNRNCVNTVFAQQWRWIVNESLTIHPHCWACKLSLIMTVCTIGRRSDQSSWLSWGPVISALNIGMSSFQRWSIPTLFYMQFCTVEWSVHLSPLQMPSTGSSLTWVGPSHTRPLGPSKAVHQSAVASAPNLAVQKGNEKSNNISTGHFEGWNYICAPTAAWSEIDIVRLQIMKCACAMDRWYKQAR